MTGIGLRHRTDGVGGRRGDRRPVVPGQVRRRPVPLRDQRTGGRPGQRVRDPGERRPGVPQRPADRRRSTRATWRSTRPASFLLSANYSSGSVAIHPIAADGSLGDATQFLQREGTGPNKERQEGPHAHQVTFDPAGELRVRRRPRLRHGLHLEADQGRPAGSGRAGCEIHPGAGPRHLVFHPGGASGVRDQRAGLDAERLQLRRRRADRRTDASRRDLTVPRGRTSRPRCWCRRTAGSSTARTAATTRSRCSRPAPTGLDAELIQTIGSGGTWPRHLAFSKDGTQLYAANERSDTIAVFTVDQSSGALTATGTPLTWPKPVCVLPV